jgi:PKD repeat protein
MKRSPIADPTTRGHRSRRLLAWTMLAATVAVAGTSVADPHGTAEAAPKSYELAALWNMNESGGSTMNDSGPYNFDGSIGDDVTVGFTFDGATGYEFPNGSPPAAQPVNPERLVTVPSDPRLNPDAADYAIEFRYRTTKSFGNIVQKGQNGTWGGYFKFEQPSGRMTCLFKYNPPGGGASSQKAVKAPVGWETNDNQWHTIRCELRRSFGVMLFIDGVEVAKNGWGGAAPLPAIANDRPISIGGKSNCDQRQTTCDYFDGEIDYVRIEKGDTPPPPANDPPEMTFSSSCQQRTCTFDAAGSDDPDGTIEVFDWNFGDGTTGSGESVTHTFDDAGTYIVTLAGTDDDGAVGTTSRDVVVMPDVGNEPPVAGFGVSCAALTCAFDSSTSDDPDGTITSRSWDFGDGNTSTSLNPAHTYAKAGTYPVTLTVTDDDGASVSASKSVTVTAQGSQPPPGTTTRFVPITPERLFDTRPGESAPGPKGLVEGGSSIEVDVTGSAAVPDDAAAVAINLTAIGVGAPSYVTAWPTGSTMPPTSSLNIVSPGQVRANTVVVPIGDDGSISLYTLRDAHLLGDIAGYYTAQATATRAGRTVTLPPQRLFDTRPGPDAGPKGLVGADDTIVVQVTGEAGVPASRVDAVVLNVTATGAAGPGFVTVWDEGSRPTASSINVNVAAETVPNLVIVPVDANGAIRLSPSVATHLLADVLGYVTDASAPSSLTGLFVPLDPDRVFDTRPGEPAPGPKGQIAAGATIRPAIAGAAGIPDAAGGVLLNVTMVGTAPSFGRLWPAGGDEPTTSNVNVGSAGDVRANGAVLALGTGGDLDVTVSSAAHVIADVAGYFVG